MQEIALSINMDKVYDVIEIVGIIASVILLYWGLLSFNVKKTIIGVFGAITIFGITGWLIIQNMGLSDGIVRFLYTAGGLSSLTALVSCGYVIFNYRMSEEKKYRNLWISTCIVVVSLLVMGILHILT